jgi:hypothetical protein
MSGPFELDTYVPLIPSHADLERGIGKVAERKDESPPAFFPGVPVDNGGEYSHKGHCPRRGCGRRPWGLAVEASRS